MTQADRKEELFLQKRALETQKNAFYRKQPQFFGFLDLNEQNILHNLPKEPEVEVLLYGGFPTAERKMAGFFPVERVDLQQKKAIFPIELIRLLPKHPKFAQKLSHRDFLGAVMNLGVERSQVGDLIVKESEQNVEAYIFVTKLTSELIRKELTKVRNTNVICELCDFLQVSGIGHNMEEMTISISSERIDGIIGHVFHLSRSQTSELFRAEKVYRNSKVLTSQDKIVNDGDVISVRGYGKFRYDGECYQNKKGKLVVKISKYI